MSFRTERYYLRQLKLLIEKGDKRDNRTGVKTLAKNGLRLVYDLEYLPILTARQMKWEEIVEELLWFISGSTNANKLAEKGLSIWKKHTSRAFLDSVGLTNYEVGDVGPYVGFQWRHFGAVYKGMNADYTNKGLDQLKKMINGIRENPTSRRFILFSSNPLDEEKTGLPPCIPMIHFLLDNNNKLDCVVTQRSGDMALGVPWNSATYAIFTMMIAHVTGLKPGKLYHNIGDAHIYECNVEGIKELIQRETHKSPSMIFNSKITDIDDFTIEDFELFNYTYEPEIKMKMVV